jgi:hypothetical protein
MKKSFYIFLTIILGLMLAMIAHSLLEVWYLDWAGRNSIEIIWSHGCAFPAYFNYGLFVIGAIGGYFLGQTWWRIVYIEKRRWGKK